MLNIRLPIHWTSFCFKFTNTWLKFQTSITTYLLLWFWNSRKMHCIRHMDFTASAFGCLLNTNIFGQPQISSHGHFSELDLINQYAYPTSWFFMHRTLNPCFNLSQQHVKLLSIWFGTKFDLIFTRARLRSEFNSLLAESLQSEVRRLFNQLPKLWIV